MPPDLVLAAATQAADAVQRAACGQLAGAYLHGSAVLGGWNQGSDVDLLLVVADGLERLDPVAAVLAGSAFPGTGLECSVVSQRQAAAAGEPPWPFLLHVATGGPDGPRIDSGAGHPGDRDLLMHYVVCRAAGFAVSGPPPAELIGPVPRAAILGYLADELDWGLANAAEPYAVLNACRALVYLADGAIVSKVTGGQTALRRGLGPSAIVSRALDQQEGRRAQQPPGADAMPFVRSATAALRAAALRAAARDGEAG